MGKASRRKRERRSIPMTPEVAQGFAEMRVAFREKFGRDPGPEDPVFFDPNADVPRPISPDIARREIGEAMVRAGIPPDKIYATMKTGMMPTENNLHMWSESDMAEWNAAIEEYEAKTRVVQ